MAPIITIAVLLIITGLILYNAAVSQEWHNTHRGKEAITENKHTCCGVFYVNNDDKRIFVPKPSGGGYTLNLANPLSYFIIVLFLGAVASIIIVS